MKGKLQISDFKFQLLILLIFGAVLVSCRPKGILSSREMRKVLVDLHKADATIQVSGMQYGHNEALNIYYSEVLEKHGITQAQFDSSIVWYTDHPLLFDKIYPKVLAQLKAEEAEFLAQNKTELRLMPELEEKIKKKKVPTLTPEKLDSMLWVTRNGYPSTWHIRPVPFYLMQNTEE